MNSLFWLSMFQLSSIDSNGKERGSPSITETGAYEPYCKKAEEGNQKKLLGLLKAVEVE